MIVGSVSIVICTFNRAPLLRETLDALQEMNVPDDCAVEIIVVDNNSTDGTEAVVADSAREARFRVVSLRETRQGKSFALNTALEHSQSDVLALLDDDVLPPRHWLEGIVRNFRERDVTFVFGKVLPRWEREPPAELLTEQAQDIWGPLALVDYGDEPTAYRPEETGQRLPIGANLSFSRAAIREVGGWRTDLGKANNTLISGEDHEIFMRLKRHNLYAGYYDPEVSVRHFVPASRVTRRYFRRWFFWHGRTQALMFADLHPELDFSIVPTIAGAPRFAYRQALQQIVRFAKSRLAGSALDAFVDELYLIEYAGFFAECWRSSAGRRPRLSSSRAPGPRILRSR